MTSVEDNGPLIFISYTHLDRSRVSPFFDALESRNFNVWMDYRLLKGGQNWDFEIKRALGKASLILIFLSNNAVNKRGYVQREAKLALDKLKEKLEDDIYIIPIKLDDDVTIPEQIQNIHCISAADANFLDQLSDSINHQLERLGFELQKIQEREHISWNYITKKEQWDGIPGYDVELQFINFRSKLYPNIHEISDFIKGKFLHALFEHREDKLSPIPESFNYGQDKYARTNTYDANCNDPIIRGRIISIQYGIHWYGAGAAHPNTEFLTFCFTLDPVILISSLDKIFKDKAGALLIIQEIARNQLFGEITHEQTDADMKEENRKWINSGTENWKSFGAFTFNENGIHVFFSPYQVASYAEGSHFAEIPYKALAPFIKSEYLSLLGIGYFPA